ncbi:hypothetical protein L0Z72_04890 [candidate division KSB1 bacterium]|nr:hypothetical protein [candidate division KSB1 bacterium]
MSHAGKPLNQFIFTIHKLLALASVIFAGIIIFNIYKNLQINAIDITLIVFIIIFFLALFITGVFLSFEKPLPGIVLLIHKIGSVLIAIMAIILIYLLARIK